MRRLFSLRRIFTILGVLLLSALVYFGGAYIPLAEWIRWAIIGGLVAVYLLSELIGWMRTRAAAKRLREAIADDAGKSALADEEARVRQNMAQVLMQVRRTAAAKGNSNYLYASPWYVMIGPPGSGKTTALSRSRLNILETTAQRQDSRSFAGTRDIDWWFLDNAVLVDTAGRYAIQDSDVARNRGGWLTLLKILRETKPRQPINGVLMVVSTQDLLTWTPEEREQNAKNLRERLFELKEKLGVRFPVYVLVTKTDLLPGFVEFFDDLTDSERQQVLGITLERGEAWGQSLPGHFDDLVRHLSMRVPERLKEASSTDQRQAALGFTARLAGLKDPVTMLLADVFSSTMLSAGDVELRGLYFTSGVQEGRPIDRLVGTLERRFGGSIFRTIPALNTARSFFITELFRQVIFPEAGLGGHNPRAEKRRRLALAGTIVVSLLAGIGAIALSAATYLDNEAYLKEAAEDRAAKASALEALDYTQVSEGDLLAIAPLLTALRQAAPSYGGRTQREETAEDSVAPGSADPYALAVIGFSPQPAIGRARDDTYENALRHILLPHLILLMEQRLRDAALEPPQQYEALRTYLMMGDSGEAGGLVEPTAVGTYFLGLDEEPGELVAVYGRDTAPQLAPFVTDLIESGAFEETVTVRPYPLDADLIAAVRQDLFGGDILGWAYGKLATRVDSYGLQAWTAAREAGPAVRDVFLLPQGELAQIDGMYTRRGFEEAVSTEIIAVGLELRSEQWVYGDSLSARDLEGLERRLAARYISQYVERWRALRNGIRIKRNQEVSGLIRTLDVLGSDGASPLDGLLNAIAAELRLTGEVSFDQGADVTGGLAAADDTANRLSQAGLRSQRVLQLQRINSAFGDTLTPEDTSPIPVDIAGLFPDFLGYMDNPGNLDQLKQIFRGLSNELSQYQADQIDYAGLTQLAALERLVRGGTPVLPISTWSNDIFIDAEILARDNAGERLNADWQRGVLPECQRLTNAYPFRPSRNSVSVDDFSRFFGPGGTLDTFMTERLNQHFEITREGIRRKSDLTPDRNGLLQLARGVRIAEGFSSGGQPQVRVAFSPSMQPVPETVASLTLGGGEPVTIAAVPRRITAVWPGEPGESLYRVTVAREVYPPAPAPDTAIILTPTAGGEDPATPPPSGQPQRVPRHYHVKSGPWGLFRFLTEIGFQLGEVDRQAVILERDGATIRLEIEVPSAFTRGWVQLRDFRCPPQLVITEPAE